MHRPELARRRFLKLLTRIPTFVIVICLTANLFGQMKFPKTPEPGELVQDYAEIINDEDNKAIRGIQFETYEQFDTPIVVVTISSKAEFKAQGEGIERVAYELFNRWQIGKRIEDGKESGKLINQGILLLVSVGDRKARIELGDDWGHRWDNRCDEIMQRSIVKRFKKGDYSGGILEGVKKLATMAEAGPKSSPSLSLFENMDEPINQVSPIPKLWAYLGIGVGLLIMLLGAVVPEWRTPLIITGLSIIALVIFLKILLWVIAIIIGLLSKGKSSDGGWSGDGGFSSGGFSGGGGATGSW